MPTPTEKCTGKSVKITNEQIRQAIAASGRDLSVNQVRARIHKGRSLEEAVSFDKLTIREAARRGAANSPFRESYKKLEKRY